MEHNRILAIINKFTIKSINSADVRIWSLGIISHAGAALLIWLPKKKLKKSLCSVQKKITCFAEMCSRVYGRPIRLFMSLLIEDQILFVLHRIIRIRFMYNILALEEGNEFECNGYSENSFDCLLEIYTNIWCHNWIRNELPVYLIQNVQKWLNTQSEYLHVILCFVFD